MPGPGSSSEEYVPVTTEYNNIINFDGTITRIPIYRKGPSGVWIEFYKPKSKIDEIIKKI
jgi:hypothetical protein